MIKPLHFESSVDDLNDQGFFSKSWNTFPRGQYTPVFIGWVVWIWHLKSLKWPFNWKYSSCVCFLSNQRRFHSASLTVLLSPDSRSVTRCQHSSYSCCTLSFMALCQLCYFDRDSQMCLLRSVPVLCVCVFERALWHISVSCERCQEYYFTVTIQ